VGSLVYARVSLAHKDMEPELECFNAQTRKSEGFGELKSGFQVSCSLNTARECVTCIQIHARASTSNVRARLLDPAHFLLPLLGSRFPLEVAIGINGRVWCKTPEVRKTIAVVRCIEAVDEQGLDQAATVKLLNTMES
jgi:exosome complex component RRP40